MSPLSPTFVICLVILALSQYVTFCTGVCEECFVTYLPNFDDTRITGYNLWSRKCPNVGVCFRFCYSDSPCVSYQYNEDTQSCYGYRASFTTTSAVQVVSNPGIQLYLTCKGLNHFGAACNTPSDCHVDYNDCIGGSCRCQAGYTYSTATWDCFKYYFGCYEDRTVRMLPSDFISADDMTILTCIAHCRSNGKKFAGLQYSSYCFCGNTIQAGYIKYANSQCGMPCKGNPNQMCGDSWKSSVYATRE